MTVSHVKPAAAKEQHKSTSPWPAVVPTLIVLLLNALWFAFDHHWPHWDGAGHAMSGIYYYSQFSQPEFLHSSGLDNLLVLHTEYPPLVYITSGAIKLALGTAPWTESIVSLIFYFIMCVATYGIAINVLGDRLAASLSVLLVNAYPVNGLIGHMIMLDYPGAAMTALGLWALVSWKRGPGWNRSLLLGIALGLACLTKQTAGAYLAVPCAAYLAFLIFNRRYRHALMLSTAGIIATAMILPWYIANYDAMQSVARNNAVYLSNRGLIRSLVNNIGFYLAHWQSILSPVLAIAFVAAFISSPLKIHKALTVVSVSAIGGTLLFNSLDWYLAQSRYIMPALVLPALYTAYGLSRMWRLKSLATRLPVVCFAVFVALQTAVVFFTPYPLSCPGWLNDIFGKPVTKDGVYKNKLWFPPEPKKDWGIEWMLSTISDNDSASRVWFNLLPNTSRFNKSTLTYAAVALNKKAAPQTLRVWTTLGDKVDYSPEKILEYRWHVLKTGDQGHWFHEGNLSEKQAVAYWSKVREARRQGREIVQHGESADNYRRMEEFIRTSGNFELFGTKTLPDGETLSIYRRIDRPNE